MNPLAFLNHSLLIRPFIAPPASIATEAENPVPIHRSLSPWMRASALALLLAGGCRRNVPRAPGIQDAALPTADVVPEAQIPQDESERAVLSKLITEDISRALATDNGRAAAALLQRDRSRPVNGRQCEAAARFLQNLGEILSVVSEEQRRTLHPGLFRSMTLYGDAVERNPDEVLTDLDRLTNPEDTLAFLQWLYAFANFYPLPNFEAALRHVPPGHLSPQTVAAVSASEFWDTLLREDLLPSAFWTPATSVAFGRLNQDGSRDGQFSTLLRFLLLGRGYSLTQLSRVLESRRPDLALSNRAPDLAALVREMGRRDSEAFPIGCVNCAPGGGYLSRMTHMRQTGRSFLFPPPDSRDR